MVEEEERSLEGERAERGEWEKESDKTWILERAYAVAHAAFAALTARTARARRPFRLLGGLGLTMGLDVIH